MTPLLQEGIARLSTHIPSFAKAANEFAWWTHVTVDPATARRITEAAGAVAVAAQTTEAERILHDLPPAPPGPERLVFSVDGAMVPILHGRWAEVRTLALGKVTTAQDGTGQPVHTTHELSYFSRLTESARFAELAVVETHRRGIERAGRVGAVVDGAEWCQTFIDLHAPHACRILDFPHAAGYLTTIGQTVSAGAPLLTDAQITHLRHDLKHTGPTTVLATVQALVAAHPDNLDLPKQVAYLEKRVNHLQYPTFQAAGWPIGSGLVESANKLVVEERLKGPGMHWAEAHVNPMLALRNAICSDRWNEIWTQIAHDQRRQAHAQRIQRRTTRAARVAAATLPVPVAPPPVVEEILPRPAPVVEAALPVPPARIHPWRKAWSIRRQCELAAGS